MIDPFVLRRRERWQRLGGLLDRAASPRGGLSLQELDEVARLYRRTTGDLAIARRDFPQDPATAFINQLVSRAYAAIYREAPAPFSAMWRFFAVDLPRQLRAAWPYLGGSAALLFLPLIAAGVAAAISDAAAELLTPPAILAEIREGRTWFQWEFARSPFIASFIMTHNIDIAAKAFAGGMLAGVGTVAILIMNGVSIGGISGALVGHGLGDRLVGFVSPHGFLELTAVVVAGACGLMLGRAILWPGLQTRRAALVEAGRRSLRFSIGSQLLLIPAGLLEGFVSPLDFPWPFKLAIGLGTAAVLAAYLALAGRGRTSERLISLSIASAVSGTPAE